MNALEKEVQKVVNDVLWHAATKLMEVVDKTEDLNAVRDFAAGLYQMVSESRAALS